MGVRPDKHIDRESKCKARNGARLWHVAMTRTRKRPEPGPSIALFVYGTLKRGHTNHDAFCRGVLAIEEALVRGCLYIRPDRIPFLEVPERDILADGTEDLRADAFTQERLAGEIESGRFAVPPPGPPSSGPDIVHGELLVFDDPETRLAAIDRLEGFRPAVEAFIAGCSCRCG